MGSIDRHIKALAGGYSQIVFTSAPAAGLVLLLTTAFNPNVAGAGLLAVAVAYVLSRILNFHTAFIERGFYIFNPLLSGMAVGYVFRLDSAGPFVMAAAAGVLALLVSMAASGTLTYYMKLPVLSLPFCIAAVIIYLAAPNYPGYEALGLYPNWEASITPALPVWLDGLFKSFGMIFFLPHALPGMIVAGVVLLTSRILFTSGVAGYFAGALVSGLLAGSFSDVFSDPYSFNYIVTSMALWGVFTIPSLRSGAVAMLAVCVVALLRKSLGELMAAHGLPVFALPFNIVTMLFLYAMGSAYYKHLAAHILATPEDTLDHYLAVSRRFKPVERTMYLPLSGKWTVWQGFDGEWTHKGEQRYAYDFLITGGDGKTHRNGGGELTDYHAFGKPVLSPVRGRVVRVISGLADNPIGQVDKSNMWGNIVVVHDVRGFYVAIAHLMKDSVAVFEGAWLERGTFIGKCGNSGYSPQPHVHIQAQEDDRMLSRTLPFTFVSFTEGGEYRANGQPETGAGVEPLFEDKSLAARTSFMLGDRFTYEVLRNGKPAGYVTLTVRSAEDGTFYFDSGRGRLYFGKFEGAYYTYRVEGNDWRLKAMFMALPGMPLGWRHGLKWTDIVPANAAAPRAAGSLIMFASSFWHDIARIRVDLSFRDQDNIEGAVFTKIPGLRRIVGVELDAETGFKTIRAGAIEMRRLRDEKVRG